MDLNLGLFKYYQALVFLGFKYNKICVFESE